MGKSLRETIQRKQIFIGQPFLDKELIAPDGSSKKISDFVEPGHITLIEFWASWWSAPAGQNSPTSGKHTTNIIRKDLIS